MTTTVDTAIDRKHRRARWTAIGVKLLLGVGYVVLASQVPVSIQTTSGHDDGLFWSRAMHIVDGGWLGAYDQLTLAKGPTYSIFLAVNHVAGTSVLVSMALLHLAGSWLVTHEVERLGMPRWGALAMFTLILFHPALVPTRVIRDDIYAPLALMALAGALRASHSTGSRWPGAVVVLGGGLGLGFLWTTREEGVWVVPGLVLLALMRLVEVRGSRAALVRLVAWGGLYCAAGGLVVGAVMMTNSVVYDRAVVTDVTDSAFSDAVTALTSIEEGPLVPRVPVTEAMRREAYRVSPATAELRPWLEAPDSKWRGIGCPGGCDDFGGGWWMWALRDAVAQEGYYRDATTAAAFYERVADEIHGACDSGALRCRSSRVPFMPHLTQAQWRQVPGRLLDAAQLLGLEDGTVLGTDASAEPHAWLEEVRTFLGRPVTTLSPTEGRLIVAGWLHDPGGGWMQLRCRSSSGAWESREVERRDSPDVAAVRGPEAARSRFSLDLDLDSRCWLQPSATTDPDASIALDDLVAQGAGVHVLGAATLQVEAASAIEADPPPTWARGVVDRLTVLYGWLLPFLLCAGLLATLWAGVRFLRGVRSHVHLLVVALAAWCLVTTRSVILVLVDITSFDALHAGYMTAGFPLAVIAAVAGLGASWLARTRRGGAGTVLE